MPKDKLLSASEVDLHPVVVVVVVVVVVGASVVSLVKMVPFGGILLVQLRAFPVTLSIFQAVEFKPPRSKRQWLDQILYSKNTPKIGDNVLNILIQ